MFIDAVHAITAVIVLWVFGVPVVFLAIQHRDPDKGWRYWHAAPFVGCAAIILVSQTLF